MKSGTRVAVAAAAMVAALGLVTGCGGDGGSDSGDAKSKGGGGKDEQSAAATSLSAAQLERAAVTKADVKGFEIQKMSEKEFSDGGAAKAEKAECQPIASLMGSSFDPAPKASVYRTYAQAKGAKLGGSGMIRLSSYGDGDAERTVKDLRGAVSACGGGFAAKDGSGKKSDVARVTPSADPKLGDESLSFSLVDAGKDKAVVEFAVARTGSQLSVFFGVNLTDPTKSDVPAELVKAQVAKVEKANAS
ncbi:hypothetical protein HUT19_16955 [Streptomyces sp. NA02950]|uniref:hypothetical protein n=1 Tax=Streptomyces sp. NA02950 TaxID=2742137 RepID=UPI0015917F91|nr:hypothetical protein [Streptomyces sp. NA02950]QKV93239.1 hypothetical protein HUT19_16955 [Streptomyces sp. NA02950]